MKILATKSRLVNAGMNTKGKFLFARVIDNCLTPIKTTMDGSAPEYIIKLTPAVYKAIAAVDMMSRLNQVFTFTSSNDSDVADKVEIMNRPSQYGNSMINSKDKDDVEGAVVTVSWTGPVQNVRVAGKDDIISDLLRDAELELKGKTPLTVMQVTGIGGRVVTEKVMTQSGEIRLHLS